MADPVVIPALSLIQVVYCYNVDNQACFNTWLYELQSAVSDWYGGAGEMFLEGWQDLMLDELRACQSTDVNCQFISIQPVYTARYRAIVIDLTTNHGTQSSVNLPSVATINISRFANEAKRYGMGRIFLGGCGTAMVTGSVVNATGFPLLNAAAAKFTEPVSIPIGPTNMNPVLCNYHETPANRWPVAATKVQNVIRVQRRREVGRGI